MLDAPESSPRARWLVALFWPLRCRCKWGEPASFSDIESYLRMRGHEPALLFDWMALADAAALEWMAEQSARERGQALRKAESARRPIRH